MEVGSVGLIAFFHNKAITRRDGLWLWSSVVGRWSNFLPFDGLAFWIFLLEVCNIEVNTSSLSRHPLTPHEELTRGIDLAGEN